MPRRKFIDKKTATTLHVLHRPQHDPSIHDEATPSVVFYEAGTRPSGPSRDATRPSRSSSTWSVGNFAPGRSTTLNDLASEYGGSIRRNEGEAAEYGVYYDDTEYDYMQHLRDLGSGGEGSWVEPAASQQQSKKEGKGKKQDLADALRDLDLEDVPHLVPASIPEDARSAYSFPSFTSEKSHTDRVIESQLSVPNEIAGFQPDMDPRLREVLEALEDDAYVDADDEDDVFGELSGEGAEVSLDEFERLGEMMGEDDEDGWESDDTVKAAEQASKPLPDGGVPLAAGIDPTVVPEADPQGDGAWLAEFSKFKKDQKSGRTLAPPSTMITGASSKLYDLPEPGRKKKRKGALTDTSSYSMTSSSLFRNENQTLLDARFDRLEEDYSADAFDDYEVDDDGASMASGMTGTSKMSNMSAVSGFSSASRASAVAQQPKALRSDFGDIMDDFLAASSRSTAAASKRQGKGKGALKTPAGIEQLDEIRKGLGPARVSPSPQKT